MLLNSQIPTIQADYLCDPGLKRPTKQIFSKNETTWAKLHGNVISASYIELATGSKCTPNDIRRAWHQTVLESVTYLLTNSLLSVALSFAGVFAWQISAAAISGTVIACCWTFVSAFRHFSKVQVVEE